MKMASSFACLVLVVLAFILLSSTAVEPKRKTVLKKIFYCVKGLNLRKFITERERKVSYSKFSEVIKSPLRCLLLWLFILLLFVFVLQYLCHSSIPCEGIKSVNDFGLYDMACVCCNSDSQSSFCATNFEMNDYKKCKDSTKFCGKLDIMKEWKSSYFSKVSDIWSNSSFFVYSFKSGVERVASFSSFRNTSTFGLMKLSKFGFYYTGEGETLMCAECASVVQASQIVSPPSDRKYHASEKCPFAQTGEEAIGTACTIGSHSLSTDTTDQDYESSLGASAPSSVTENISQIEQKENTYVPGIEKDNTDEGCEQKMKEGDSNCKEMQNLTTQNYQYPKGCDDQLDTDSPHERGTVNGRDEAEGQDCPDEAHFEYQSFAPKAEITDSQNPDLYEPTNVPKERLPLELQSDDIKAFFIKSVQLTVKIKCQNGTTGTGSAFLDCTDLSLSWLKELERKGQLSSSQLEKMKDKKKYFISVMTSKHIISPKTKAFDQTAASKAEVEFVFDTTGSKELISGIAVRGSSEDGDYRSYLICSTTDKDFVKRLFEARQQLTQQIEKLSAKVKETLTRYSIMVSHPYGGAKRVSVGKTCIVRYALKNDDKNKEKMVYCSDKESLSKEKNIREVLLYNVKTVYGSSGSPVFTFRRLKENSTGKSAFRLCLWIHNGREKHTELGGSIMKPVNPDFHDCEDPVPLDTVKVKLRATTDPEKAVSESKESKTTLKKGVPPLYPDFFHWKVRMESFGTDYKSECSHSIEELALGGFFHTKNGDCVRCFYCGLGLKAWRKGDDMYKEHQRSRPNCGFLNICLAWNKPLKIELMKKGPAFPHQKDGQLTTGLSVHLLTEENRILKQQFLCKMCFRHQSRELFLPCGEIQTCEECAGILSTCPACHTKIDATVSVFMS